MALYPYQEKVKQFIQAGQSVILQAPTGAGKTRAALAPFIESFFDLPVDRFPKKCIYSVPMRVLANQFEAEYQELSASYHRRLREQLAVSIQTGDRPEDPKLEGDLIFTTIDQTLSNFLCIPYALSNRQANLNAGAITSSYLVFDEFHLFPPKALATTLAMLKMLKGITPFLLMTATFSGTMLEKLSKQLDAVVIPEPEERAALQKLPSQQKERSYQVVDSLLTAEQVLQHNPSQGKPRSIAICNTVKRAQELFEAVDKAKRPGTVVKLLHSRFYKEDREEKEMWIRREFGKEKDNYQVDSAILIATQVIEVGLDITCDALHTELAPANAVLQRAGRCARYEGESGEVYIYQVPANDEGIPLYHPYHNKVQSAICESTWQAFDNQNGSPLTFVDEQNMLSDVHGPADAKTLQDLQDARHTHREMMQTAMGYQERGLAHELIRDVDSRGVIVHPDPREDTDEKEPWRLKNPWRWQSFNMFRGSVFGAFKDLEELAEEIGHDDDWVMMHLVQQEDPEEWGENKTLYRWSIVRDQSQLKGALLVAVHPRLARYSEECGFQLGVANDKDWTVPLRQWTPNRNDRRFTYEQETYLQHINGLYRAYGEKWWDNDAKVWRQPLQVDMAYAFKAAEQRLQLPAGMLDNVIRLAIAGHDLGKLGKGWQTWVHRWQELIEKPVADGVMLAHTDYDGSPAHNNLQKKLKKEIGPRPPHAAESAYGLLPGLAGLAQKNPNLVRATTTAITCHHSAMHQGGVQAFQIHPQGRAALQEALDLVALSNLPLDAVRWSLAADDSVGSYMIQPDKMVKQMLPYFLLVRVLRLADQRSQQ